MSTRRDAALGVIARLSQPLGHFIAGEAVAGRGEAFDILEPATGGVLGQAVDATTAEVDAAVAAA